MENKRDDLKNKFKKGDKPTEVDYADLIDSFVNKIEDPYFKFDDLPIATTTVKGIAEQATLAEVAVGEDVERFVTPAGAKRAVETFAPKAPVTSVNGDTGVITIPDYTKDDTSWNTISLGSGITNVVSSSAARYRKKVGIVFLDGEIRINSSSAGNTELFKLENQYSPSRNTIFYTIGSNGNMVKIQISSSGQVIATNVNSTTGPVDISLSGISFIAK